MFNLFLNIEIYEFFVYIYLFDSFGTSLCSLSSGQQSKSWKTQGFKSRKGVVVG